MIRRLIRHYGDLALFVAALLTVGILTLPADDPAPAPAPTPTEPAKGIISLSPAPPCETEDSNGCVWDASARGNGLGRSFVVDANGNVTYISSQLAGVIASTD